MVYGSLVRTLLIETLMSEESPGYSAVSTFTERRWERQHAIGWRCIVAETHEGWYTAWAQPPGQARPTPAFQGDDRARCQVTADEQVPAHPCRCPAWREIVRPRRWPRKQPADALLAQIGDRPARVVDLSYGGFKLEIPHHECPPRLLVAFRDCGLTVQARAVWTQPAPSGLWWWGAEVSATSAQTEKAWRQFVDSLRPAS